jgi:peptidoglycan hydrolase-like protein with peptidoglycan-binding domain
VITVTKLSCQKIAAALVTAAIVLCPLSGLAAPIDNTFLYHCSCVDEEFPQLEPNHPDLHGPSVLEIQEALYFAGYYLDRPTGRYDEKTTEAVRVFQKDQKLAVDGIVKYHVWLKLAKYLEEMAAAPKSIPGPKGKVSIVIDTFRRRIMILDDNKFHAQFPIAIGKAETPSPVGNWKIINKAMHWGTGFGTRWMGLNVPWGVYGIHGTNKPWSIGSMASHGCFRMWNKDVETIYPWIKQGTKVTVMGNAFSYLYGGMKPARPGELGSDVIYLQEKLKRLGFYQGPVDGLYGPGTEKAVKAMQKHYGRPVTGAMSLADYAALGVK